nr:MAG TPA: MCM OB domain [Caudoviricetes sp.]
MKNFTVLLQGGTTGTVLADSVEVGDVVTITGHDENGMVFTLTGVVEEVLIEHD